MHPDFNCVRRPCKVHSADLYSDSKPSITTIKDQGTTLGPQDFLRTVSALCLYCHESVNRMKIRDAGGLRLFVTILQDEKSNKFVKEKIIKSLMQFAYDDLSLKVLQHAGLVPALVKLIEAHNAKTYNRHSCEEYICDMDKTPQEDFVNEPENIVTNTDDREDVHALSDNAGQNVSDPSDSSGR